MCRHMHAQTFELERVRSCPTYHRALCSRLLRAETAQQLHSRVHLRPRGGKTWRALAEASTRTQLPGAVKTRPCPMPFLRATRSHADNRPYYSHGRVCLPRTFARLPWLALTSATCDDGCQHDYRHRNRRRYAPRAASPVPVRLGPERAPGGSAPSVLWGGTTCLTPLI